MRPYENPRSSGRANLPGCGNEYPFEANLPVVVVVVVVGVMVGKVVVKVDVDVDVDVDVAIDEGGGRRERIDGKTEEEED